MIQVEQTEIRELSLQEIDRISGGGIVTDTIVNIAKDICHAVNPPTAPINPPTIQQIGHFLGSIF